MNVALRRVATLDVGVCLRVTRFQASLRDAIHHGMPQTVG